MIDGIINADKQNATINPITQPAAWQQQQIRQLNTKGATSIFLVSKWPAGQTVDTLLTLIRYDQKRLWHKLKYTNSDVVLHDKPKSHNALTS